MLQAEAFTCGLRRVHARELVEQLRQARLESLPKRLRRDRPVQERLQQPLLHRVGTLLHDAPPLFCMTSKR